MAQGLADLTLRAVQSHRFLHRSFSLFLWLGVSLVVVREENFRRRWQLFPYTFFYHVGVVKSVGVDAQLLLVATSSGARWRLGGCG
jgi:hypothetical protein